MGKQTTAQLQQQMAQEKAAKTRIPKEGVEITMLEGDPLIFDGDFEAQLTPTGVVCVVELVKDLLNQNKGQPIPVIRRFVNTTQWAQVIVK